MSKIKIYDDIKVHPASEFILVKVDQDEEQQTSGGLVIPTQALANKKTVTGVIVEVGPGRLNAGADGIERRNPMDCEAGQHILFAVFIGYPLLIKGEEHVIIKYNDIMCFVDAASHEVENDGTVVTDDKRRIA